MARASMAALILRVRDLINDAPGASQTWTDDQIQGVMDESRVDYRNEVLKPSPTFTGSTLQYLDYYHDLGGWEDGTVLKQFLTTIVTPSASEPIAAHWTFAATTLPPVYLTGSLHDIYRAAADLLERWAARWVLSYNVNVDGQSLQRGQAALALQALAKTYRMKQRPGVIMATRSDLASPLESPDNALAARSIDYFASGDGR